MWTVGPSRPRTSPDPIASTPPTNFAGSSGSVAVAARPVDRFDVLDAASVGQRLSAPPAPPGWLLAAAAATGISQPGPASWFAHSTNSSRNRSDPLQQPAERPADEAHYDPATVAVTQMSTAPRIESSGSAAEAPGPRRSSDVPGILRIVGGTGSTFASRQPNGNTEMRSCANR